MPLSYGASGGFYLHGGVVVPVAELTHLLNEIVGEGRLSYSRTVGLTSSC